MLRDAHIKSGVKCLELLALLGLRTGWGASSFLWVVALALHFTFNVISARACRRGHTGAKGAAVKHVLEGQQTSGDSVLADSVVVPAVILAAAGRICTQPQARWMPCPASLYILSHLRQPLSPRLVAHQLAVELSVCLAIVGFTVSSHPKLTSACNDMYHTLHVASRLRFCVPYAAALCCAAALAVLRVVVLQPLLNRYFWPVALVWPGHGLPQQGASDLISKKLQAASLTGEASSSTEGGSGTQGSQPHALPPAGSTPSPGDLAEHVLPEAGPAMPASSDMRPEAGTGTTAQTKATRTPMATLDLGGMLHVVQGVHGVALTPSPLYGDITPLVHRAAILISSEASTAGQDVDAAVRQLQSGLGHGLSQFVRLCAQCTTHVVMSSFTHCRTTLSPDQLEEGSSPAAQAESGSVGNSGHLTVPKASGPIQITGTAAATELAVEPAGVSIRHSIAARGLPSSYPVVSALASAFIHAFPNPGTPATAAPPPQLQDPQQLVACLVASIRAHAPGVTLLSVQAHLGGSGQRAMFAADLPSGRGADVAAAVVDAAISGLGHDPIGPPGVAVSHDDADRARASPDTLLMRSRSSQPGVGDASRTFGSYGDCGSPHGCGSPTSCHPTREAGTHAQEADDNCGKPCCSVLQHSPDPWPSISPRSAAPPPPPEPPLPPMPSPPPSLFEDVQDPGATLLPAELQEARMRPQLLAANCYVLPAAIPIPHTCHAGAAGAGFGQESGADTSLPLLPQVLETPATGLPEPAAASAAQADDPVVQLFVGPAAELADQAVSSGTVALAAASELVMTVSHPRQSVVAQGCFSLAEAGSGQARLRLPLSTLPHRLGPGLLSVSVEEATTGSPHDPAAGKLVAALPLLLLPAAAAAEANRLLAAMEAAIASAAGTSRRRVTSEPAGSAQLSPAVQPQLNNAQQPAGDTQLGTDAATDLGADTFKPDLCHALHQHFFGFAQDVAVCLAADPSAFMAHSVKPGVAEEGHSNATIEGFTTMVERLLVFLMAHKCMGLLELVVTHLCDSGILRLSWMGQPLDAAGAIHILSSRVEEEHAVHHAPSASTDHDSIHPDSTVAATSTTSTAACSGAATQPAQRPRPGLQPLFTATMFILFGARAAWLRTAGILTAFKSLMPHTWAQLLHPASVSDPAAEAAYQANTKIHLIVCHAAGLVLHAGMVAAGVAHGAKMLLQSQGMGPRGSGTFGASALLQVLAAPANSPAFSAWRAFFMLHAAYLVLAVLLQSLLLVRRPVTYIFHMRSLQLCHAFVRFWGVVVMAGLPPGPLGWFTPRRRAVYLMAEALLLPTVMHVDVGTRLVVAVLEVPTDAIMIMGMLPCPMREAVGGWACGVFRLVAATTLSTLLNCVAVSLSYVRELYQRRQYGHSIARSGSSGASKGPSPSTSCEITLTDAMAGVGD